MTATLWLNTEREETIELGGTLQLYVAFRDMEKAVGGMKDYPELFGVVPATELQEDVDPDWLATVREQASAFLAAHGEALGEHARWILAQLSESATDSPPTSHGPAA